MPLGEEVSDDLDISVNTANTYVVKEYTYHYSCVTVSFSDKFVLSYASTMYALREIFSWKEVQTQYLITLLDGRVRRYQDC